MTNKATIVWGFEVLESLDYEPKSQTPEDIQHTHWSSVLRYDTALGYVYLKQTPQELFVESEVTQVLRSQFKASVPKVIAVNSELHCFLVLDAGTPLRGVLKQNFDVNLLSQAIDKFTLMQKIVSDDIQVLLDLGVPDWRLNKLPDLFEQLLDMHDLLLSDGLSSNDLKALQQLKPIVSQLCNMLSSYNIPETLVQCDFHDNNMLINPSTREITFIDLGEIVISHSFFSLVGCLWQAKKHHGLSEHDSDYLQLVNACFRNFTDSASMGEISAAIEQARKLWFVFEALAQARLMKACGAEKIQAHQPGKLATTLRETMQLSN